MRKAFSPIENRSGTKRVEHKNEVIKRPAKKLAGRSVEIGSRTLSRCCGLASERNFLKMLSMGSDNFRSSYSQSVASRITNEIILFYGLQAKALRGRRWHRKERFWTCRWKEMKLNNDTRISDCQRSHKIDKSFIEIKLMKWKSTACFVSPLSDSHSRH